MSFEDGESELTCLGTWCTEGDQSQVEKTKFVGVLQRGSIIVCPQIQVMMTIDTP